MRLAQLPPPFLWGSDQVGKPHPAAHLLDLPEAHLPTVSVQCWGELVDAQQVFLGLAAEAHVLETR